MVYNLSVSELIKLRSDGTWSRVLNELKKLGGWDAIEDVLEEAAAAIHVLWDAELIDANMMLVPNEGEWYLLIDKSVRDRLEKDIPLELLLDDIREMLLHEIWHFYSQEKAIDLSSWSSLVDGDAFAPAELNANEEAAAELFSLFVRLGNPDDFVRRAESSDFDIEGISKACHNAAPEDIAKYFIACKAVPPDFNPQWHYFKYSMGRSEYDDLFIPHVYSSQARAQLRDVDYMRNARTALNKAIVQFFGKGEKTNTVHVRSKVGGMSFCCHAAYYKFPFKKGQRHNVVCVGKSENDNSKESK